MKVLYKDNCKILKKLVEETRRWKDFPYSWVGRINIVKMAVLLKAISTIPMKNPVSVFTEIEKSILKFIWKHKRQQIA
jgi:hypothetical protein